MISNRNAVPVILLICLFTIPGCYPDRNGTLEGVYQLTLSGDEEAEKGKIELIRTDTIHWGRLILQREDPRVVAVSQAYKSGNSYTFTLAGGSIHVVQHGNLLKGRMVRYDDVSDVVIEKLHEQISAEMRSLRSLSPFQWDIISKSGNEVFPGFNSGGDTLYYSVHRSWAERTHRIMFAVRSNGRWQNPDTVHFSDTYSDRAPFVFPDENRLLFTSDRPHPALDENDDENYRLWITDMNDSSGIPEPLPIDISRSSSDYHGAVAENGTIYFSSWLREGGFGRSDIYRVEKQSTGYGLPENLGKEINTSGSESDVYVSPDEQFIIFVATDREDSYGGDDLYISHRDGDRWSTPENLGPPVNSFGYEFGPMISPDSKYLYFTSDRRGSYDIFRIPAADIPNDQLRENMNANAANR